MGRPARPSCRRRLEHGAIVGMDECRQSLHAHWHIERDAVHPSRDVGPFEPLLCDVPVPPSELRRVEHDVELLFALPRLGLRAGSILGEGGERHDGHPRDDEEELNRQRVFARRAGREGPKALDRPPDCDERAGHERCAGAPRSKPDCRCHQQQDRHVDQHRKRGRDGAGTNEREPRCHEQEGEDHDRFDPLSAGDLPHAREASRSGHDQRNDGDRRQDAGEKARLPVRPIGGLSPAVQRHERRVEERRDERRQEPGAHEENHGFAERVQPRLARVQAAECHGADERPGQAAHVPDPESSPAGCRLRAARRGGRRRWPHTRRPTSEPASGGGRRAGWRQEATASRPTWSRG